MRIILSICLFVVFHLNCLGQKELQRDKETNLVVIKGREPIRIKSTKKVIKRTTEWSSKKIEYPSMVLSIIKSSKDTLVLKGLTEVPSLKHLHPITFKLIVTSERKQLLYHSTNFYFEDIKLTLGEWLDKYSDTGNERNLKNVELISAGIESHVHLGMKNLSEFINQ